MVAGRVPAPTLLVRRGVRAGRVRGWVAVGLVVHVAGAARPEWVRVEACEGAGTIIDSNKGGAGDRALCYC